MYKKFNVFFILCSVLLLLGFAAFNVLIDPYFQYHYPFWNMEPVVNNERYQNPGIAKNFSYDTMIIGSSMSENFRVSEVNEIFNCTSVKLTYPATRTGNMNYMFEKAFATHDVKNVILGLDMDPLFATPGTYYFSLPEYLYDENVWNDVEYVLNKSVAFDSSAEQIYLNSINRVPDIDLAYSWGEDAIFSKEQVMKSVTWDILERKDRNVHADYVENAKINLNQNITKHIKEHPETTFYVFFPPYNVLWWNLHLSEGDLEDIYDLITYTSEELLEYDNVRLFGMQNAMPLVTELDNYKDYNHYGPEINSVILNWMKEDQYRLTNENLENYLYDLNQMITTYPYEDLLT